MEHKDPPKRTARITNRIVAKPLKILVADDDPWMLELTKRHLLKLGHKVVDSARNGREAIALAAQWKPDLVILDINMPGIDGIQAANAIQETQNVSIMLSTGAADEATLNRLRDLQIGAYLVKPFSAAQLKAAIYIARSWRRRSDDKLVAEKP